MCEDVYVVLLRDEDYYMSGYELNDVEKVFEFVVCEVFMDMVYFKGVVMN